MKSEIGSPVLKDILPDPYYNHLLLFIKALNICLQESISESELNVARQCFSAYAYLQDSQYCEVLFIAGLILFFRFS